MQSDEDMLGLLLTETKELGEGEVVEAARKGGRGGERMGGRYGWRRMRSKRKESNKQNDGDRNRRKESTVALI